MRYLRSWVSFVLIVSCLATWSSPALALRQTGLEESPEQRDGLAKALKDPNDPVGAVASTVASGLSRFLQPAPVLPGAAGMEEWKAILPAELPSDLWRDLGAYGVSLVGVEYRVLSPPTKGDRREALQPFAHWGADFVIPASVNDGLGSVLFHGIGKDQPPERIEVLKITADGNAVFLGYHSPIDYTLRHRDVALLVLGDEGEQDASIALRVGSIFFRGEVIKFKDLPSLWAELRRLRELRDDDAPNGVTIRGVIGDALEVTTSLVVGDQDSWGLVAIVDLPQDPESLEKITLIPDHLRRSGWLYRAPRPIPVDQLDPFTPPTDGFHLIGLANGMDPAQDPVGYAGWMPQQGLVTLAGEHPALGPKRGDRPFLSSIRREGEKLAEAYKGFDPYYPTDGTVAPAFFTAHGIEVNGRTYALDVRHGYNEAEVVQVFVKNAGPGVHYVHTDTSPKSTKKATSLTKQTAHNYTADERSGASGFGRSADRLESFDTEENSGYTGVVAMTSVNGVTKRLAGELADSIPGIQFVPDSSGYGGKVVTHTLVSARDGSSYIVRATFRAHDLPEAKEWIKLASRLPSPVPPPLEKPTGEIQTLGSLAGVVAPANIDFVQKHAEQEVSRTFRYVAREHLAKLMSDLGIGYHLTFLHPGQIGEAEEAEFYRTRGHFHSEPVAELVEVYDGRGEILLWETQPTDRALATRAILLSVNAGDIFFVPWGWAHLSLNRDPGQMMVFGTWLKHGVRLDYPDASLRGGPYFIGPKPAGNRGNSSYASVPDLALREPNVEYMKPALEIPDDRSLWSVAITDEARFIRILKHLLVPSNPALRPGLLFTADAAGAGMEEASRPIIGYVREFPAGSREANLSQRLLSGQGAARGQATQIMKKGVDSILAEQAYRQAHGGQPQNPLYRGFDDAFGQLLRLTRGDMEEFSSIFLRAAERYDEATREALLQGVRHLAQDPGAPHNQPPVSYHNPARYVYALLRRGELDGFAARVLNGVVNTVRKAVSSVDLSDIEQKADLVQTLQEALWKGRQTEGPYQYEIFYDSLVQKDGETYLTLELLLDGSADYRQGVVLELQVVIPADPSKGQQYWSPYTFPAVAAGKGYSVGLLDPIHFINARFPEWRPRAQRDIYESRIRTLKETEGKVKRQYIRPSVRQGNNPRFYEPFFRAYLAGNVPLTYHIVDALASERDYGNQGGVGSIGTMASAIVRRGGIGVTATWYLENPATARTLAREKRTLVYSYEKDHHRIDNIKDVKGFASELEPFLLAYPENLVTGWPSSNLQDETKFINQKARDPWVKAGPHVAETGVIDEAVFNQLQEIYNGTPVTPGLPSAFQLHWLRNRWLHHVVDRIRERDIPLTPFDRWYIEPDYALDGKPHTVEEMAYLTLMSWVSAQAHGHPLGPVVPSYGNVHGASAGNPSLALAGIHQYAAQAAILYGDPLPEELLAIARKASEGSVIVATQAAGYFQDSELAQEFHQVVKSAGERTEAEESRLGAFVLAQLQRMPANVLKGLKQAEQVLLREVEQAQREKRQPRPLAEVAPDVARELDLLTRQLDTQIHPLPLDRRAAITTHAASGLSAEQLSQAREYGVWVANKSTEFQNIITKQLEAIYLRTVDLARADEELSRMPAAHSVWNSNPLSSEETQRVADLYRRMWDAAAQRAIKAAKTDADRDVIRGLASNPQRPFPWFWRENLGWSLESPTGADWSAYEWLPGAHGRYMFSMRDEMTGQGIDDTLLFPNALTWGLPPTVIQMAQAEIERTIHFYHQPAVMNAVGGAAEIAAGMEEQAKVQQAISNLDSPSQIDRLAALRTLRELEQQGVKMPPVEPALPAAGWIHVHTDRSYPRVPGAYSPTHMVWAAHRQGANVLYLVDHETVAHIPEGFEAARIVNEDRATPLRVLFGVEFRTWLEKELHVLQDGLGRGVGRDATAAWVVAMGVPVTADGQAPEGLIRLVQDFQRAKQERAKIQIGRLYEAFGVSLSLKDLMTPEGNITDRSLAEAVAVAIRQQGQQPDPARIRDEHLRRVPYTEKLGFPGYGNLIDQIRQLGMTPAFTMQVPTSDLEALLPTLRMIGIGALDLSGIESHHPEAAAQIAQVIALAQRNKMPAIGGSDYRGDRAVGWPQGAEWMDHPYVRSSLAQILSAGMEEWTIPARDARILVVGGREDRKAMLVVQALQNVLGKLPFKETELPRVHYSITWQDAQAQIQQNPPHVIFTTWEFPGGFGFQVLKEARKSNRWVEAYLVDSPPPDAEDQRNRMLEFSGRFLNTLLPDVSTRIEAVFKGWAALHLAGMEEVDENALVDYVLEHPESVLRWRENGAGRSSPVRLAEAITASSDRRQWRKSGQERQLDELFEALDRFDGEIYLVPQRLLPQGVHYNAGSQTLYLAREVVIGLRGTQILMVRDALNTPGDQSFRPIRARAADILSQATPPPPAGMEDPLARPYLVRLSPDYTGPVAVVGKGGGTDIKFQAAVLQGLVDGTEVSGPTVVSPSDTEQDVLDRMAESAARVIDGFGPDRILYVYLSFPGYFDPNMVLTRDQENIAGKWKGLDVSKELEARLARRVQGRRSEKLGNIRVILVHDGTGHANGERSRFGRFPGASNLFFIGPGTGIATRGIVNGKPFTGGTEVQYLANEAPHTLVWDPKTGDYRLVILQTKGDIPDFTSATLADGQPNPLYGAEDLEDRASGPGIARYAMALARSGRFEGETAQALQAVSSEPDLKKIAPDVLDKAMKDIVSPAVPSGDPLALQAARDRGQELGIGLAVLLAEFNQIWGDDFPIPPHIVVGGGVSQIGAVYFEAVKEGFRGRLQRYGRLPDVDGLAGRLSVSDILVDSDRELLGGLPTESQVADHLAKLSPVPGAGMEEVFGYGLTPLTTGISVSRPPVVTSDNRFAVFVQESRVGRVDLATGETAWSGDLLSPWLDAIEHPARGSVWVGDEKGLTEMALEDWTVKTRIESLNSPRPLSVLRDGNVLFFTGTDRLGLLDVTTGQVAREIDLSTPGIDGTYTNGILTNALELPDGRLLLGRNRVGSGDDENDLAFVNPATGEVTPILGFRFAALWQTQLIPYNGKVVLAKRGSVTLFDPATFDPATRKARFGTEAEGTKFDGLDVYGGDPTILPETQQIIVSERKGLARVDLATGEIKRLDGLSSPRTVAQLPEGLLVAEEGGLAFVGSESGQVEGRMQVESPLSLHPLPGEKTLVATPHGLQILARTATGMEEEVWVLPLDPIENLVEAVLRFTKGTGTDAGKPADWVSFFGRDMRYRMQGVYLSENTESLRGRLRRVAMQGGGARYIRLAVERGILNVDPALKEKPNTASVWREGALGQSLKIIFRPENAGLALLLPEEGVEARVVVEDLAQRQVLFDLRPDLAGAFIQADESGGVERAMERARQELGPGAMEVNEDLSHHPATLVAQIQRWLRRFPWKAPRLTDQVRDAVLAGTQA